MLLAGGLGTRLGPITNVLSKHMLLVYDKPMIYYPLSTLIAAGIREIAIVAKSGDLDDFQALLGNGQNFGVSIEYFVQETSRGIADGLLAAEEFVANENVALILGDNLFYGTGLGTVLEKNQQITGALIYAYRVSNPKEYGVVEFNELGKAISIQEKPKQPRSNFAIPGLYFYDNRAIQFAKELDLSSRGELEITDLNKKYLEIGQLEVQVLPRGSAWLDTGTFGDLLEAGEFVRTIEKRQGLKIGSPEEIAWRKGYISSQVLEELGKKSQKSDYGKYLLSLLDLPR